MLGCIILIYIDAHFSHGRRLPDVSFKVSTSSRPLTQITALLGLTPKKIRLSLTPQNIILFFINSPEQQTFLIPQKIRLSLSPQKIRLF